MPRELENWLEAYSIYTQHSEAPETFNFWCGVSTVAGALRRKVYIDQVKFKWYPGMYIIFVSPPGVATKSTTVSVGMNLLKQIEGINFGPSSMTWQGLLKGFQTSLQMLPVTSDKDLLNTEYIPMSAITCEVSELGTFFDANEKQLSPVLIDLWDGRDSFDRWLSSQESTHIENPWLNLIAATTPSWLRESFTDSMIGGGLVSRVIFVYADKKRHLIPYINELVDSEAHLDLERKLVHDLGEISKLQGAFTLTRHAIAIGSHWYYEHWEHPPDHMTSERFQGYRARKQTHLHKLAMILSASESDSMIITETHLHTALGLLEGVEHDMHYVFDSIGGSNATQQMQTLLAILRVNRKMTKTEAWRQCMGVMSLKEFSEALDGLVQGTRAKIINTAGSYLIHYIELNPEITDLEEEREKRQQ